MILKIKRRMKQSWWEKCEKNYTKSTKIKIIILKLKNNNGHV